MDSTYTYYLRGPHPSAGYVKHKMQKSFLSVGLPMSYPLCYHNPMMKMKEQLFKVRIALWRKNDAFRETHIRAFDLAHAKRISNRLFGTLGVTVEPAKPFSRFDGKKIGEFNR